MKRQWILIGTTLTALALLVVVGCRGADTDVTVPVTDTVTEVAAEVSTQPVTVAQSAPQTGNTTVYYDVPSYDDQPLSEGFYPCYPLENGTWSCPPLASEEYREESHPSDNVTGDTFQVPDDFILEGLPLMWDNPWH